MTTELRRPTFLILAALADGPKHGYALIGEAAELSDGAVQLKVGTLYATLDRLSDEALIEISGEEVVEGRLRRYYRLTRLGEQRLEAEAERMSRTAAQALARLRATPRPVAAQ